MLTKMNSVILCVLGLSLGVSALPQFDSVRFFLYPDAWNLDYAQEIVPGDSKSLLTSKYNKWHFPVILIHGYGQNYSTSFPQLTKDAFLKQKLPVNVIVADWSGFVQKLQVVNRRHGIHGPVTTINADTIGKRIGEFVIFLINHGVLTDPTRVHLVGFSLGAQISGIAGQHIKQYTHRPIQRITGLDPAGPLFNFHAVRGKRLDHSDAYFVDVVHSNQGRYGSSGSSGHVDFFPNGGGPEQPGCTPRSDIPGLPGSCAHVRSWEYFTESILGSKIWACKAISYKDYKLHGKDHCHDKVLFGLKVSPTARGSFYFDIVRHDPKHHDHHDYLHHDHLHRDHLHRDHLLKDHLLKDHLLKDHLVHDHPHHDSLHHDDHHHHDHLHHDHLHHNDHHHVKTVYGAPLSPLAHIEAELYN